MRPLSAQQVFAVWERGQRRPPVERALLLLAAALPGRAREELAGWTVGERDACLLALRERTLGATLYGRTECPVCTVRLSLAVQARDFTAEPGPAERPATVAAAGCEVTFRLPTSEDQAAAAACRSVEEARDLLIDRCVLAARREGVAIAPRELPEEAVVELAAAMAQRDPQAELELRLSCAACGHRWSALLDIGEFFWAELTALAERLFEEVHTLARGYGWREQDILAMSAARRQAYIERLAG